MRRVAKTKSAETFTQRYVTIEAGDYRILHAAFKKEPRCALGTIIDLGPKPRLAFATKFSCDVTGAETFPPSFLALRISARSLPMRAIFAPARLRTNALNSVRKIRRYWTSCSRINCSEQNVLFGYRRYSKPRYLFANWMIANNFFEKNCWNEVSRMQM